MATRTSQTGKTFARHVAPFAPLALAMAMTALPASSPDVSSSDLTEMEVPDNVTAVQCGDDIADFQACHASYPTGCSKAAGYDPYLNYLKNDLPTAPGGGVTLLDQAGIDNLNTNTPEGLGQGNNHADFKEQLQALGEGSQRGIIGYLYYSQAGGAESSNCQLTATDTEKNNIDFHIGIGFDSSLASQVANNTKPSASLKKQLQQNSMVVEMTPHYRAQFHEGVWTLDNLKPALGHKVKVTGQLLIDSEHNKPSDNCALDGTPAQKNHCWRYSIWELHPVTGFAYCSDDSCTPDSGNWIPLGGDSGGSAKGAGSGDNSGQDVASPGTTRRPRGSTLTSGPRSGSTARP